MKQFEILENLVEEEMGWVKDPVHFGLHFQHAHTVSKVQVEFHPREHRHLQFVLDLLVFGFQHYSIKPTVLPTALQLA